MKPYVIILFLFLQTAAHGAQDSFYVWQQHWNSHVIKAVMSEAPTTLYPLVAVITAQGETSLVDIPWDMILETDHKIVPVIRIPLSGFKRTDLLQEIERIISQLPIKHEIQLDLDCPERRILAYTALLKSLRSRNQELALSITVLPCHLGNGTFRELATAVDWYVLQVHGLEAPETLNDPCELMNAGIAEQAIERAEKLGIPYSVALPCYAYELNFDPENRQFLYLTAEKQSKNPNTIKKRISASFAELTAIQQRSSTLKSFKNIVWFRLPVDGDRLCLPRPTLKTLQNLEIPPDLFELQTVHISSNTVELSIHNGNIIHSHTAECVLT